jgi:hypothetical protein
LRYTLRVQRSLPQLDFYVALEVLGSRVSPQLHRIIFGHVVLIAGMGFGVLLLLGVSGEYFKALRELDAARRRRLADAHEESRHEHV